MDGRELRSVLRRTSLERTMEYMHILEEENLDDRVRELLLLLSDHLPTGTKRDIRGASLRQLGYVCLLADFDQGLSREFARVVDLGGGLDSGQAHAIITKLKNSKPGNRVAA